MKHDEYSDSRAYLLSHRQTINHPKGSICTVSTCRFSEEKMLEKVMHKETIQTTGNRDNVDSVSDFPCIAEKNATHNVSVATQKSQFATQYYY